ncbi:hypothetical protein NQ317_003641 [Molorchus minor]|uniref:Uncharacterized protein n=1 Tax=Molorchus minor TaxID=1323400 RepID=A0ABQ9JHC1_9CUCU|nr:hypothetical protein NQ317_003641 [Molorchus minor]
MTAERGSSRGKVFCWGRRMFNKKLKPAIMKENQEKYAPALMFSVPPANVDTRTTITIGDKTFDVEADDLEKICDLDRGLMVN